MDVSGLYIKTPPGRLFWMASIPGAISMLASALYQLLDGMIVGQMLGETAFAALNLAMPFVIINFSLADLIGSGSAVPISICLGSGETREANNFFSGACLMIVLTGVGIGGALYAAAPVLIAWMGASGDFAEMAVAYMRVYALTSPVTTIVFAVDNYLRICGKIRMSMCLNVLMSVLSGGLELLFLGVFRLGIGGAALATSLGMFLCALMAFWPFIRGKLQLRFCKPRFSAAMIRKVIACGAPNFLNNIAGRITSILMNILLLRFGGEAAVSIYGILMYAEGFIQPLLYGMCDSLQPAVGYNFGAGRMDRVKAIERYCFITSGVLSVAAAALMFFCPGAIARLFVAAPSVDFMAEAVWALKLFALTYTTRWYSFSVESYMLAIERTTPATMISLSTALIFPVILVVCLWPMGLTGIWLNFALTSAMAGIMAWVFMRRFYRIIKAG